MAASESARHNIAHPRAREERVIALMLAGRTLNQVCAEAPISRSALWRLRKSEEFQRRFREVRQEAFDSAVNALHDGAVVFVQTLKKVCEDPKSRDSARATAARSGLDCLFRASELFDIESRLRKLEQAAGEGGK